MGRSSSSPAPAPARRASSSSACAGSWRRTARPRSRPTARSSARTRPQDVNASRPLRRPAAARADPRAHLQRQGRQGARRAHRGTRRPGRPGAPRRQQLPQLLPSRPDRLGRGRRPARSPGRARRRRPAPPAARHPAATCRSSTTRAAAAPTTGSTSSWPSSTAPRTSSSRPDDFAAFVDREREAFEARFGSYETALERVCRPRATSSRCARSARPTPSFRRAERAPEAGAVTAPSPDITAVEKVADREARRTIAGDGTRPLPRGLRRPDDLPAHRRAGRDLRRRCRGPRGPAPLGAGASSTAPTRTELARRGALDFGEQISLVTRLFKQQAQRPAPLPAHASATCSWTSSRTPTSPRSSSSSCSAARRTGRTTSWSWATTTSPSTASAAPATRPSSSSTAASAARPRMTPAPPPPGRPTRLRLEENFRSVRARAHGRQPAHRAQRAALRAGQGPASDPRRGRAGRARRGDRRRGRGTPGRRPHQGPGGWEPGRRRRRAARLVALRRPLPQAPPPRGHRRPPPRRGHPLHGRRRPVALRDAGDPRPRAEPAGHRRPARRTSRSCA